MKINVKSLLSNVTFEINAEATLHSLFNKIKSTNLSKNVLVVRLILRDGVNKALHADDLDKKLSDLGVKNGSTINVVTIHSATDAESLSLYKERKELFFLVDGDLIDNIFNKMLAAAPEMSNPQLDDISNESSEDEDYDSNKSAEKTIKEASERNAPILNELSGDYDSNKSAIMIRRPRLDDISVQIESFDKGKNILNQANKNNLCKFKIISPISASILLAASVITFLLFFLSSSSFSVVIPIVLFALSVGDAILFLAYNKTSPQVIENPLENIKSNIKNYNTVALENINEYGIEVEEKNRKIKEGHNRRNRCRSI